MRALPARPVLVRAGFRPCRALGMVLDSFSHVRPSFSFLSFFSWEGSLATSHLLPSQCPGERVPSDGTGEGNVVAGGAIYMWWSRSSLILVVVLRIPSCVIMRRMSAWDVLDAGSTIDVDIFLAVAGLICGYRVTDGPTWHLISLHLTPAYRRLYMLPSLIPAPTSGTMSLSTRNPMTSHGRFRCPVS